MPQLAAWAAAAIVSSVTGTAVTAAAVTAGTAGAFAAVTYAGLQIVGSLTFTALAGGLSPDVGAGKGRPTEWSADPDAPIPFVFGLRGTAGVIRHRDTFGPDNRYQGIVTVYSGGGPVNAFGDFIVDGTVRTFTGEVMNGTPINSLYLQRKTGTQPDTALTSPTLPGSYTLSGWTSAHKLSGKACSMITLFQDANFKRWPTGEPKVLQEIQGLLAWDPRLDSTWPGGTGSCRIDDPSTWVYSTNGAIHALKWALGIWENGALVGGIGSSVDGIDVEGLIAAANVADTNGWTCSAVAYSLDDKYQIYLGLLQAAGAIPARKNGKISCISRGAAPASIVTITNDDTAGPFEINLGAPREGRFNTAIPRCVSADHEWDLVDLEQVTSATYVTEDDGATRSRGIVYPFVPDEDQAAQLAAYDIADSREGISGTIPLKPYLRDLEAGDCFTIDEDAFALSSQKCLVVRRSFNPVTSVVEIEFRSETDAKHAWALAQGGVLPATPSYGGTDPSVVPTPDVSDWSVAAGTGEVPSLMLAGGVPSGVNAAQVIVEYRLDGATDWIPWTVAGPDVTEVGLTGLAGAAAFEVAVSYRNIFGVPGDRLVLSPTTTPDATITDQGALAVLSAVDTPQIVDEAATIAETQIRAAGFGGGGAITIAYRGAGLTTFTQLDEYVFNYAGEGSVTLQWIGLIQWQANAARSVKFFACLDQTPTYSAGAYHDYYETWPDVFGNQNALTTTSVLTVNIGGVSTGSHTLSIWAQSDDASNPPYLDIGAVFSEFQSKK